MACTATQDQPPVPPVCAQFATPPTGAFYPPRWRAHPSSSCALPLPLPLLSPSQVLLLMEMLNTEPWRYYPLTLQFLSSRVSAERGRCPPPPAHMRVLVAPLEVRAGARRRRHYWLWLGSGRRLWLKAACN